VRWIQKNNAAAPRITPFSCKLGKNSKSALYGHRNTTETNVKTVAGVQMFSTLVRAYAANKITEKVSNALAIKKTVGPNADPRA